MAYASTKDAGFRNTAYKFGATTIAGAIRATMEKIVEREILQAEAENTPVSRPVDRIDARVVFAVLDGSGMISEAAAPENAISEFTEADGGAGSVTLGPTLANGWVANHARNQGGHLYEQELAMEGDALVETVVF